MLEATALQRGERQLRPGGPAAEVLEGRRKTGDGRGEERDMSMHMWRGTT